MIFILLVVVVIGALVWLVTRSRRNILTVEDEPRTPEQAIDEVSDVNQEPGRRPLA